MRFLYIFLILLSFAKASFIEGKKVFDTKCSSCHKEYISMSVAKENFYEKNNTLLNLKAPSANMMVWAMLESSKKIGDEDEAEFREMEIASFLKDYLENPDRFNSVCDDTALDYYDNKNSMKGELREEDYEKLAIYFLEFKDNIKEDRVIKEKRYSKNDEEKLLKDAKNGDKKILVYATSGTCYFCIKMDNEVFKLDSVKKLLNKHYIFLKIDMDKNSLPFDLQKEYRKITPSFFFLDSNGTFIKQYPGAWIEEDFIKILNEYR